MENFFIAEATCPKQNMNETHLLLNTFALLPF